MCRSLSTMRGPSAPRCGWASLLEHRHLARYTVHDAHYKQTFTASVSLAHCWPVPVACSLIARDAVLEIFYEAHSRLFVGHMAQRSGMEPVLPPFALVQWPS